jgi:cyclophilin family peptidyl-prolyl cis-trans isomerase
MSGVKDVLKDNKKILLLAVGLLLACVLGLYLTKSGGLLSTNSGLSEFTKASYTQPEQVMEANIDYKAVLKTSVGDITVDLFEKETPITVNSFLFLVGKGYYENMIFHRVIKDFVIQTGDPTATGTGGPGYQINDEITSRKYEGYVLGMANAGANTNGSQFFITSGNMSADQASYLDGKYTIFGKVTKGFSVVDAIEKVATDKNDKPINSVSLESVQILEN